MSHLITLLTKAIDNTSISYQPLWLCCWRGEISSFFVYKKLDPSSYNKYVLVPSARNMLCIPGVIFIYALQILNDISLCFQLCMGLNYISSNRSQPAGMYKIPTKLMDKCTLNAWAVYLEY